MEASNPQLPTGYSPRSTLEPASYSPSYAYGAITLYGGAFQPTSASRESSIMAGPKPRIPYLSPDRARFGLCRFPSPVLTASQLISLPARTEMLQFRASPLAVLKGTASAKGCSPLAGFPFGHIRINACLRLPGRFRGLLRPSSAPEPSHPPGGLLTPGETQL